MQRVWLEAMPYYCSAIYFACDGVPLRLRDERCMCAESVECGKKVFEYETEATKWCRAWLPTFRILDWDGQAGWSWRPPKRKREDAECEF